MPCLSGLFVVTKDSQPPDNCKEHGGVPYPRSRFPHLQVIMCLCIITCMHSRIATPDFALIATQAHKAKLSQVEIAKAVGASQSQVSRILSGKTSASSKLAQDICIYVSTASKGVSQDAVAANTDLMDAIASVWDGSPGHARALATVIRSLGVLKPTSPQ
jgi:hypothetical protein